MKNLFLLFVLFIGTLTTVAQSHTKNIDKDVNDLLKSMSKVYHQKVTSVTVIECAGVRTTKITYNKNDEQIEKVIKVEKSSSEPNMLTYILGPN